MFNYWDNFLIKHWVIFNSVYNYRGWYLWFYGWICGILLFVHVVGIFGRNYSNLTDFSFFPFSLFCAYLYGFSCEFFYVSFVYCGFFLLIVISFSLNFFTVLDNSIWAFFFVFALSANKASCRAISFTVLNFIGELETFLKLYGKFVLDFK